MIFVAIVCKRFHFTGSGVRCLNPRMVWSSSAGSSFLQYAWSLFVQVLLSKSLSGTLQTMFLFRCSTLCVFINISNAIFERHRQLSLPGIIFSRKCLDSSTLERLADERIESQMCCVVTSISCNIDDTNRIGDSGVGVLMCTTQSRKASHLPDLCIALRLRGDASIWC